MRNFKNLFYLDDRITFLNHGSFGAVPKAILKKQNKLRRKIEKEPVKFFLRDYEEKYEKAREALAGFVKTNKENIVFIPNATTGINIALRSLKISSDDEIIVTNMEYNACRNALYEIAKEKNFKIKELNLPFPLKNMDDVLNILLDNISERTRYLLIDHIVSQTAIAFDIKRIIKEMRRFNIETIVDGAHSVGQIPLNLDDLKPLYFTSNCHKWLFCPKGCAFLYVRDDAMEFTRPLIISHGANSQRKDKSKFFLEFQWMGTYDPTSYLVVPYVFEYLKKVVKGGINEIMKMNRELCLKARNLIVETLNIDKSAPDEMVYSMASFPLKKAEKEPKEPLFLDELQDRLFYEYKIEVPIIYFPKYPERVLRISAQIYNTIEDYQYLCEALKRIYLTK